MCMETTPNKMKKLIQVVLGKRPLTTIGLIIATSLVYGAIALMVALYFLSPTISGERLF